MNMGDPDWAWAQKESARRQKQGQATWEDMDTSLAYVVMELGKPKLIWSLKLARQVKDNRKGFLHKCIGSKRETKESVGSLFSEIRDLVTREKWV